MNLARLLEHGRSAAESLMTDTFSVYRATGNRVVDPDTGISKPELIAVAESISGKVQTSGGIAQQTVTGSGDSSNLGGLVPEWSVYLHFPMSTNGLQPKDVAICTASRDPDLVGRHYRLVNMQSEKTHATAKRWNVQEIPQESDSDAG